MTHWKRAAKAGHGYAAFNLYVIFSDVSEPFYDTDIAMQYLTLAANSNIKEANYYLGMHYLNSGRHKSDLALPYLKKAADAGYLHAHAALGEYYSHKINSVESFAKAEKWMQRAALSGSKESQHNLMSLYDAYKELIPELVSRKKTWQSKFNAMAK